MDGFPRPFSKSLLRNVLVEYAVLVRQLLVENSPPPLRDWSTRTTDTRSLLCILWTYKYSWQTNRSNWSYSSCDRSRCPNDSKALSMSSSHAINTLKHHSLDLPANRPDMSDPVRAWKTSIAEARLCPNLLYTGWTGMFLF